MSVNGCSVLLYREEIKLRNRFLLRSREVKQNMLIKNSASITDCAAS